MKKSFINIVIFLGFAITVIGIVVDALISPTVIATANIFVFIASALGVCFVYAKNSTLKNVGYALTALAGTYGLSMILNEYMLISFIGLTVAAVGALLQLILICIKFFGFVKNDSRDGSGDISVMLMKYKELEKEKVISEEEFNDLKTKTIATIANDKAGLEDLKKWKKLLDQNVITEEEFAGLKAKVFTK